MARINIEELPLADRVLDTDSILLDQENGTRRTTIGDIKTYIKNQLDEEILQATTVPVDTLREEINLTYDDYIEVLENKYENLFKVRLNELSDKIAVLEDRVLINSSYVTGSILNFEVSDTNFIANKEGQTVTVTYDFSGDVAQVLIDENEIEDLQAREYIVNLNPASGKYELELKLVDIRGGITTKSITLNFNYPILYGDSNINLSSNNESDNSIQELINELTQDINGDKRVSFYAGVKNYVYLLCPVEYGTCRFVIDLQSQTTNQFEFVKEFADVDINGVSVSYYVYKSENIFNNVLIEVL